MTTAGADPPTIGTVDPQRRREQMRRFVVEAAIDAVIALVIIVLLSFIVIAQPFPFGSSSAPIIQLRGAGLVGFLIWAAILVLVNRFARPVLVAFTGRLLLSTMGAFLVIINAFALWLTSVISPIKIGLVADPTLLWLLVAAALYTLLSGLANAVLGLNRPTIGPDSERSVWRLLESLPTPRRNVIIENLRLQQVYDAIYSNALDITLENTPIGPIRRWFELHVLGQESALTGDTAPERIRGMLQQLGPTYVKIGQMAASRADLLPAEWIAELSKLQSEAAPFGWDDASQMILNELGHPADELFGSIDHEPFAAASTAQVHRATLKDGTLVAVKVQRPRIVAKTKADLGVIQELATIAERRFSMARKIGARGMVDEFAAGVLKELDYRNEAYHARRLADGMTRFPQIHVPVTYDDLSSERVLTMEFVKGIKISKVDELRDAGLDTSALGSVFIRAIIKQVLIDGFFHGDPHPGNVLADPETNQIVFLDLGLVGQLDRQQRLDLLGLIYSIKGVDIQGIADGLIALGQPSRGFDEAGFRNDIDRLARQYLVYGKAETLGAALSAFLSAVFNNGLRLDTQLTLAMKAVIQAEETARALSYDLDLGQAAAEEARAALLESITSERLQKQFTDSAIRIGKEVARRVPSMEVAAFKWLDMFNRGKITVEVDTSSLGQQIDKINDIGRQATVGIVVVGQLIGTAIVMAILLQPSLAQFQSFAYVAMIAFGLTLVVSFVVLFRMLFGRSGEDEEQGSRRR
jgi:ubiquinone biosynthesis protein